MLNLDKKKIEKSCTDGFKNGDYYSSAVVIKSYNYKFKCYKYCTTEVCAIKKANILFIIALKKLLPTWINTSRQNSYWVTIYEWQDLDRHKTAMLKTAV